jgi:hypothetical protein
MFKRCNNCGMKWATREEFLADGAVRVFGFQANPAFPGRSAYLFDHNPLDRACRSTIAVESEQFLDLYDGLWPETILMGGPECRGHCALVEEMDGCDRDCRFAPYRAVLRTLARRTGVLPARNEDADTPAT